MLPLVQQTGRNGEALFGGSIAAVAVGLEVLRLRQAQLTGTLSPDVTQSISDFLRLLARELLLHQPADPQAHVIERARADAARIVTSSLTIDALRIAASLRVIAAAVEDFPEFFRPGQARSR
jgi:hypothetical protein